MKKAQRPAPRRKTELLPEKEGERILYLDPIGGVAGDMFLAAALDLGAPLKQLVEGLKGLPLKGYRIVAKRAARHSIEGTHVDVKVEHEPHPHAHRPYQDIVRMLKRAKLSERVRERALAVFAVLGEAEAKIHGVPIGEVEFHEVGSVDSIVDVVGAALALELLGSPTLYAGPPPLGSGTGRSQHGAIPIPAPATLEILREVPVRFEGVGELTTPTGAALLKALCQVKGPPEMVAEKIGYGVGTRDPADRPNLLRAVLGRAAHGGESTWVVECNLDDMSPQLFAPLFERLLARGALDVYLAPVLMKKGRPGYLLGVICAAAAREAVVDTVLRETTTLGVRAHPVERFALARSFATVKTPFGPVRVKIGHRGGEQLSAAPELEDCLALSRRSGAPLKEVLAAAMAAFRAGK